MMAGARLSGAFEYWMPVTSLHVGPIFSTAAALDATITAARNATVLRIRRSESSGRASIILAPLSPRLYHRPHPPEGRGRDRDKTDARPARNPPAADASRHRSPRRVLDVLHVRVPLRHQGDAGRRRHPLHSGQS